MDGGTNYLGAAAAEANSVLAAPIVGNVDTFHLFLVTGILIVSALAWRIILSHIME